MSTNDQGTHPNKLPKVGVVLGSGGLKPFAAIALFEFLDELQIDVDLFVGCSGGALVCAGRAAGYGPQQMQEILRQQSRERLTSRLDYSSILSIAHPRLGRAGRTPAILKPEGIQRVLHRLFES